MAITRATAACLLLLLLQVLLLVHPGQAHGPEHHAVGRSDRVRRFGWGWPNWWYQHDANGTSEDEKYQKGVVFQLFTRENPDEPELVDIYDAEAAPLQHLDTARPTKVATHGWNADGLGVDALRKAFLATEDVNFIAVKWSDCDTIFYPVSERHVPLVGERVALLLDFLHDKYGVAAEALHLIGHSLGAHISGLAGRMVMRAGTVGRITGLDPAGPLIPGNESQRLDRSDALFVDVIHTCVNVLGYRDAIGHVDFYPNGGTCIQPGCLLTDLTQGTCSHNRGYKFLEESIYNRTAFKAFPCAGASLTPSREDPGQSIVMGLDVPANATGSYCLTTRSNSPFAIPEEEQLRLHLHSSGSSSSSSISSSSSGASDEIMDNEVRPEAGSRIPGKELSRRIYRSFMRRGLAEYRRRLLRRKL